MKNDSHKYPFGTPTDKHFDSDQNGKLEGSETFFRDWNLDEAEIRRRKNLESSNSGKSRGLWEWLTDTNIENPEDIPSNSETFLIFLMIILMIASAVFTIYLWAYTDHVFLGYMFPVVSCFVISYVLYRLTDGKKKK